MYLSVSLSDSPCGLTKPKLNNIIPVVPPSVPAPAYPSPPLYGIHLSPLLPLFIQFPLSSCLSPFLCCWNLLLLQLPVISVLLRRTNSPRHLPNWYREQICNIGGTEGANKHFPGWRQWFGNRWSKFWESIHRRRNYRCTWVQIGNTLPWRGLHRGF